VENDNDEWLSTVEAAKILGVTSTTLRNWPGHSTDQMVNHYAKKVSQRSQAREAMNKIVQFDKAATENG